MKQRLRSAFNTRQTMLSEDFELFYYSDLHFKTVQAHSHDYYEFYFFLEGEVDMVIGKTAYPLTPGDILAIPPGLQHYARLRDPAAVYRRFVFWISQNYCKTLLSLSPDYVYLMQRCSTAKVYQWHMDAIRFNTLQGKLLTLLEEIHSDRFGRSARIPLCVNDLVLCLNRMVYEQEHPRALNESLSLYEGVTAYIESHLSEDLSLDSLAGVFYVSKFYLSHLFQENTGLSVHQFVIKKRLSAVCDAIAGGSPIKEAVYLCGFTEYSSFYRAFCKEYGMPPSKYQELYRQKAGTKALPESSL